jgi:hypothetical protein
VEAACSYKGSTSLNERFENNLKEIAPKMMAVLLQKKRLTESNFLQKKTGEQIPETPEDQEGKKSEQMSEDVRNDEGKRVEVC